MCGVSRIAERQAKPTRHKTVVLCQTFDMVADKLEIDAECLTSITRSKSLYAPVDYYERVLLCA